MSLALPALCSLQQVKFIATVPLATTGDDPFLTELIADASAAVRKFTLRDLASVTYTERYDGQGTRRLTLRQSPVTAVASVSVGAPSNPTPFALALNTGYVWDSAGITRVDGGRFCEGPQSVTVVYTAGDAPTDADLAMATAKIAALRYKEASRLGQKSKSMGGEVISFDSSEWPEDVLGTLERHRSVTAVRAFTAAPAVLA